MLTRFFSATADAVFATDSNCRIVYGNRAFGRLFLDSDHSPGLLGRYCHEAVCGRLGAGAPGNFCSAECPVRRARYERETIPDFDMILMGENGTHCRVNVGVLIAPQDWKPASVICILRPRHHADDPIPDADKAPGTATGHAGLGQMTPCEQRVARLIAEGLGTNHISAQLHISPTTVRNHIRHIYTKLDVHSRVELIHLLYHGRKVKGGAMLRLNRK